MHRRRMRWAAMPMLLSLVLPGTLAAQSVRQDEAAASQVHPAEWPAPRWPLARDGQVEARIAALLAKMTVEEKVGQVIQGDIGSLTPEDVRRYHLGSVLNGGNSGPGGDDLALAPKWLALADAFYAASTDRGSGGAGIPLIWGTDAVHGHSNIIGATLFPHNIGLGAADDPELIERIGRATAEEIRVTGQEWTFAPTITVPQDPRWGRSYEGYSSDPALVARYAARMILGLQGKPGAGPILQGPHVIASTKHFLADGGTYEGRDQGDARIDERTLREVHGRPYVPAIESGVATVMTSFSSWQGVKLAGHKGLVTDVLKNRMHFGGFVVTDWNAHGQVAGCTNASCPQAINAGIDMYMAPDSWRQLYDSLLVQVKDGTVPMARLDDAVSRILRVKLRLGLFDAGKPSSRPLAGQWDLLGSPAHRAVAREAVGKSLVLLKNQGVLPLKPGANILVAGDAADDIARQSGGWTLTWQGTGLGNDKFPGATSIWAGIQAATAKAGGSAELAPDGKYRRKPDAAIVVFGETPYAEFQGDIATLQLRPELMAPIETMKRLKAEGIPVIAVLLTGRPLFMGPALNAADAFVVAWLPGSEGAGIADRLFAASPTRAFTGKLPMPWPATARADGPVLYPLGHGLHGGELVRRWKPVNVDPGVAAMASANLFFAQGTPAAGWSLDVTDGAADSTRITTVPAAALGGRVRVTAVDTDIQEGGRAFAFAGGASQQVALSPSAPLDLGRQANGDVMVIATLRLDTPAATDARIVARCGSACSGGAGLSGIPTGRWLRLGVPLRCFAASSALTAVQSPFAIESTGAMRFALSRVELGTDAERVLPCS
jgi:beta-glucosidase